MQPNIQEITKEVEKYGQLTTAISAEVKKVIVGQDYLIERLLIGLLANGHILVEGVPGLAKTTAVKTLARAVDTSFQRIQFTPDLLPGRPHRHADLRAQNRRVQYQKRPAVFKHHPCR